MRVWLEDGMKDGGLEEASERMVSGVLAILLGDSVEMALSGVNCRLRRLEPCRAAQKIVLSNADHPNHESVDVCRILDVAEDTQF